MRRRSAPLLIALLAAAAVAAPQAQATTREPATIFLFRQSMWVNLHHFLYVLGRSANHEPDISRAAVANAPKDAADGLATLSASEREEWQAAVAAYAAGWSRKDAVFDADLSALTLKLTRIADLSSPSAGGVTDADARVLERVAPLYRKVWWPEHQKANAARIAEIDALVREHGDAMVAYLTRAYHTTWPKDGYPLNVAAYTNWAGAYSTAGNLLVVSSTYDGIAGLSGMEIVFHEASHQWDEVQEKRIAAAAGRAGRPTPDNLDHAIVFYTAGEAVRRLVPSYTPYAVANGLWRHQSLAPLKAPLDAAWKPYLDGAGSIDDALEAVIRQIR